MLLQQSISSAGGIYKRYSSLLKKLNINTFEDFLYHFPHRYEDFSQNKIISALETGETVTVKGIVLSIKNSYTKFHKTLQKAVVTDGSGILEVTWFNQPYLTKTITTNAEIVIAGQAERMGNKITMLSPEYEILTSPDSITLHTGRLVPVYPETRGVTSKWLRRQIFKLLEEHNATLHDRLPTEIKKQFAFLNLTTALSNIHFPRNYHEVEQAKQRLAFDELFYLQLKSLHRKQMWKQYKITTPLKVSEYKGKIDSLINSLPFPLTDAQNRELATIFEDLQSNQPMNRLLQGDVGSGKTIVAALALFVAILNGKQGVIMAPTEILAEQHYKSLSKLFSSLDIRVDLITGSTKVSKTRSHKPKTQEKTLNANILVGTHALLYDKADFSNAGVVVIDEQHRFGVEQRALMREKGNNPHVLTMTATPIPRTMALTVYADLDVSYLDEMPVGRKKIKTWLVPPEKRQGAYQWIEKQIKENQSQAFVICPFIEESESMQTVKAASVEFERLTASVFSKLKLGLLHGRMRAKEKEAVLMQFKNKQFDILVATPVVEVGIDIPNATIIVIEASERFGLSQLHQLRGRVGRGDKQSYCLLFAEAKNDQTITRLKAMETTHSGAKLAELDLQIRGSGDLYGTMQSGYKMLKIASFSDQDLLLKARTAAKMVYSDIENYPLLSEQLQELNVQKISQD